MPKAPALTGAILEAAAAVARRPVCWFDKLPADVQAELVAIRDALRRGEVAQTKSAIARGAETVLRERGLAAVKWPEIVKWLDRK